MRVALFAENFSDSAFDSAPERYASGLAKALAAAGHETHVVAFISAEPGSTVASGWPNLPLAKRLRGIEVEGEGDKVRLDLFEGTTSAGVALSLLHATDGADLDTPLRVRALAACVSRFADAPELVLAFEPVGAYAAQLLAEGKREGESRQGLLLVNAATLDMLKGRKAAPLRKALGLAKATLPDQLKRFDLCLALTHFPLGALEKDERPEWIVSMPDAIDAAVFNPSTSAALAFRFDAFDQRGRELAQGEIRRRLELDIAPDATPLVLLPTVLGDAPTLKLEDVELVAEMCLADSAQLVIEWDGQQEELGRLIERLKEAHPGRVAGAAASPGAAHLALVAAADIVVLSGESEARRLEGLLALRFGAIPVLARAGGIDARLLDLDECGLSGYAVLADSAAPEALREALKRALYMLHRVEQPSTLRQRLMLLEVGFEPLARLVEVLFAETNRD